MFAHSVAELPPGFKSKLCTFFAHTGSCPRKDFCTFSHGELELKQHSPNGMNDNTPPPPPPALIAGGFKTKLCINYPSCPRGEACTFAHGEAELQTYVPKQNP